VCVFIGIAGMDGFVSATNISEAYTEQLRDEAESVGTKGMDKELDSIVVVVV
jgi:hypothetical protein